MSKQTIRPSAAAAASAVISGLIIAVWPQHAVSVVQIAVVTVAVAAALHATRTNGVRPGTDRPSDSPLARLMTPTALPALPSDLERTRFNLHSRRIRYRDVALPWGTAKQLRRTAAAALQRQGVDVDDPSHHAAARALVSPLTWTVLTHERYKPRKDLRGAGPKVAEIVHAVLDDIDRLTTTRRQPIRGAR